MENANNGNSNLHQGQQADIDSTADNRPREWKDGRYPISQETADYYLKRDHQHQYTIPVEWEWLYKTQTIPANMITGPEQEHEYKAGRKVTKLRCQCGEEIDR